MLLEVALFLGKTTGPIIAKKIGQSLYDQLFPVINRAREKAITKTAKTLESEFPSGNFVASNFRFDSPDIEAELQKLITGKGTPDIQVLKDRMVKTLQIDWPDFSSKAHVLVETFLKYFEEECLAEPRLVGLALASIVREENAKTRHLITESEDRIVQHVDKFLEEGRALSATEAQQFTKATTALEKEFAEQRDAMDLRNIQSGSFLPQHFPIGLVNQKIEDQIDIARKSRFFLEFDRVRFSSAFARNLVEGELCGGSDAIRSRALAWCSRLLSRTEEFGKAEECLGRAQVLGTGPEVEIAHAFISSQKGDKTGALNILAGIDLPISRSAALMIVAFHEGSQKAVDWLKAANIAATDLDPGGKYFLLMKYLELSQWSSAFECLDSLTDNDLEETPALRHGLAITRLLTVVPAEFRGVVIGQVPFGAADFPLASDTDAIRARGLAQRHFAEAAHAARKLNCPVTATIDDEYELWLELRDPQASANGKQQLEVKLRDSKSALPFVHLGLQFGIKLDLEAIEREIDRQISLSGGMTHDAALARFALAFTKKTPEEIAEYVSRHQKELSGHISKKTMQFLQIEMFSKAGLRERANDCLRELLEEGISDVEESRLRLMINEAEGTDPVKARKEQFKTTDSLGDLLSLVEELENKREWGDVCEYGEILFRRTHSLHDAERLAKALSNAQRNDRLLSFLTDYRTLARQSKNLRLLYCWSLYDGGELLKARTELERLEEDWDNPNYRALKINLGIAMGDWGSLSGVVSNEYRENEKRSAEELINAAQLALHIGLLSAKELVHAAARKGDNNAAILTNAYLLASSAGWENDPEIFQWLYRAAELSGVNGPIKKVSLKEILHKKPEWDRRESEIWQSLSRGSIPMFVAAEALNKSLIDLTLFPAFANLSQNDPRRRGAVPAYSGKREPRAFNMGRSIGIDATALLTLSLIGLLDKALDAFETIYVPHSTLAWLFQEKQKATFHQPSRIRDAHHLRHLLATEAIKKFSPKVVPDSDLSSQVGEELASLIAEAERPGEENSFRSIVVRSSPVHRVATLMEEEADLSEHSSVLSSCWAVVDKLREKGQITAEKARKAGAYLQLHEKPWPNQPDIEDGAVLYLDDLTITYFLHLGILEKLRPAGLKPIVSHRKVSEANELIAYESVSSSVNNAIEHIRSAIYSRIESGKIRVDKRIDIHGTAERPIAGHPSIGLVALARHCDAIIADDRFFNRHANIDNGGRLIPVFSTIDLVDGLNSVSAEDRSEYRTLLRRAGHFFIPIGDDELKHYLEDAVIKGDKVVETAELRAIRENILRIRMSTWLQVPEEAPWLDSLFKTFIRVLKGLWRPDVDFTSIRPRCNWIIDQIDIRGWTHTLGGENRDNMAGTGRGVYVLMLLISPPASPEVRKEYWGWIEDKVLSHIKEEHHDLYSWIVDWQRNWIADLVKAGLSEAEQFSDNSYIKAALAQTALKLIHPLLHESLIREPGFLKEYGLSADSVISFDNSGLLVLRSHLFNSIRTVYSGTPEIKVIDTKRRKWKLSSIGGESDLPKLVLSRGKRRLTLPDFCALSSDSNARLRSFREATSEVNVPSDIRDRWLEILARRALTDDEMNVLHDEFRDTPMAKASSIRDEIVRGRSSISSLVPHSRRYFERLIGPYDGSATIRDYAAGPGKALFQELFEWRPYEGLLFYLFLSSHSSMTNEIDVGQLDIGDFVGALEFLKIHGDRISQLGAVEFGLRLLSSRPELESHLACLIELIRDDDTTGQQSRFKLLSTLFMLVDGELSRTRLLSTEPPFYRRLAALAQAALIERQIGDCSVDLDSFQEWAFGHSAWQFFWQSLADMRAEPRWNANLGVSKQLREEFFGRIINAAKNVEQNLAGSGLLDLILGPKDGSLHSLGDGFHPFLPGPLEGAEENQSILPPEIADAIQMQLQSDEVGPNSFVALINFALIFRIDVERAELAAEALRRGNYRLANIEDRSQIITVLNGLATVAAVTRSHTLANELRVVVRRYRHDPQYSLSVTEAIYISLVAAASHADLDAWRDFVGDWLTELSFNDLKGDEGEILHSSLKRLCDTVPELWVSCGRADAALAAYNGSRQD